MDGECSVVREYQTAGILSLPAKRRTSQDDVSHLALIDRDVGIFFFDFLLSHSHNVGLFVLFNLDRVNRQTHFQLVIHNLHNFQNPTTDYQITPVNGTVIRGMIDGPTSVI